MNNVNLKGEKLSKFEKYVNAANRSRDDCRTAVDTTAFQNKVCKMLQSWGFSEKSTKKISDFDAAIKLLVLAKVNAE